MSTVTPEERKQRHNQLTQLAEWLRKWEIVDGSGENIALNLAIDQLFDAEENAEIIALLDAG